jgi:hypothetical protein
MWRAFLERESEWDAGILFEAPAEKKNGGIERWFSRQEWKELAQSPSRNVNPMALNQWLRSRLNFSLHFRFCIDAVDSTIRYQIKEDERSEFHFIQSILAPSTLSMIERSEWVKVFDLWTCHFLIANEVCDSILLCIWNVLSINDWNE